MNSAAHVDNDINNWKTMGMSKAEGSAGLTIRLRSAGAGRTPWMRVCPARLPRFGRDVRY